MYLKHIIRTSPCVRSNQKCIPVAVEVKVVDVTKLVTSYEPVAMETKCHFGE